MYHECLPSRLLDVALVGDPVRVGLALLGLLDERALRLLAQVIVEMFPSCHILDHVGRHLAYVCSLGFQSRLEVFCESKVFAASVLYGCGTYLS